MMTRNITGNGAARSFPTISNHSESSPPNSKDHIHHSERSQASLARQPASIDRWHDRHADLVTLDHTDVSSHPD
jgi:hypothetical protein